MKTIATQVSTIAALLACLCTRQRVFPTRHCLCVRTAEQICIKTNSSSCRGFEAGAPLSCWYYRVRDPVHKEERRCRPHANTAGYCDSDWGSDPETRKSTIGFVFTFANGAIAWMSRRQPIIALSTAEAEYVAACEASMEAMAESHILTEIVPKFQVKPVIGIDTCHGYQPYIQSSKQAHRAQMALRTRANTARLN